MNRLIVLPDPTCADRSRREQSPSWIASRLHANSKHWVAYLAFSLALFVASPSWGKPPLKIINSEPVTPVQHTIVDAAQPSVEMDSATMRKEEVNIKLSWLADRTTFPYRLSVKGKGAELVVAGYVPSQAVREKILEIARKSTSWPIRDEVIVHLGMLLPLTESRQMEEVRAVAQGLLQRRFGPRADSFAVTTDEGGILRLAGEVKSSDEQLFLCEMMRGVPGCEAVVHNLRLPAVLSAKPAPVVTPTVSLEMPRTQPPVPGQSAAPAEKIRTQPIQALPPTPAEEMWPPLPTPTRKEMSPAPQPTAKEYQPIFPTVASTTPPSPSVPVPPQAEPTYRPSDTVRTTAPQSKVSEPTRVVKVPTRSITPPPRTTGVEKTVEQKPTVLPQAYQQATEKTSALTSTRPITPVNRQVVPVQPSPPQPPVFPQQSSLKTPEKVVSKTVLPQQSVGSSGTAHPAQAALPFPLPPSMSKLTTRGAGNGPYPPMVQTSVPPVKTADLKTGEPYSTVGVVVFEDEQPTLPAKSSSLSPESFQKELLATGGIHIQNTRVNELPDGTWMVDLTLYNTRGWDSALDRLKSSASLTGKKVEWNLKLVPRP